MSATLRRSARLASKANTPIRVATPVVVPAAPKKVRAPRQYITLVGLDARLDEILDEFVVGTTRIDERIKTALEDLEVLTRYDRTEEYVATVQYLFKALFASTYFGSLGAHDVDKLYALVKQVHEGKLPHPINHISCLQTRRGWNQICFFLSEVGFPTASWMW